MTNYDLERAEDLGTATGTIRGVLHIYDTGLHELAIKLLREALEKLDAKAKERFNHLAAKGE